MPTLDRDLLILEPRLFSDTAWIGQRLHRSTSATIAAGGATVTDASAPFAGLGIAPGHVLMASTIPVEITEILSATQASISLARASALDPPIPARALSGTVTIECFTFAPQIAQVHTQIIRALGLVVGPTTDSGTLGEDRITNTADITHTVALGAIHLILAAASPLAADPSGIRAKADTYRERFAAARRALVAEIDTDGDGTADAIRRTSLIHLVRG
jgi:hypothetical protein